MASVPLCPALCPLTPTPTCLAHPCLQDWKPVLNLLRWPLLSEQRIKRHRTGWGAGRRARGKGGWHWAAGHRGGRLGARGSMGSPGASSGEAGLLCSLCVHHECSKIRTLYPHPQECTVLVIKPVLTFLCKSSSPKN